MHEICPNSIAIYNLSFHQLLSEHLAELLTILEFCYWRRFFTSIANITSTLTGWEGVRWAHSHQVAGKGYVFTKISQMATIGAIFTFIYHTKRLNPWPNSSASCVVNYIKADCLLVKGIFKHLKETQALEDV